jgi:hypothetical protein
MEQEINSAKIRKRLKAWHWMLLLNASCLTVIFISLFTAPSSTPVWIWAGSSATVLAAMNFVAFRSLHSRGSQAVRVGSKTSIFVIAVGFLLWLFLEILPKIFRR